MKTVGKSKNRVKKPAFVSMRPNPSQNVEEQIEEAARNMAGYFKELLGSDDPKQLETWQRIAQKLGVEVITFDDSNQGEGVLEHIPNPLIRLNLAFPLETQLSVMVNLLGRYLMSTWGYMSDDQPTTRKPSSTKERDVLNPRSRAYKQLEAQAKELGKRPRSGKAPAPPSPVGTGWISVSVSRLVKLIGDSCATWRHREGFHVVCTVEESQAAPGWPVRYRTRLSLSSPNTGSASRKGGDLQGTQRRATDEEVTRVLADFGEGWLEESRSLPSWGVTRQFLRWENEVEVE